VSLSRNGSWHTNNVHRLVCETYYGPPPTPSAQVRHMDGDQLNNRPENLDWGTAIQNRADRNSHGRCIGVDHHAAKLSDEIVAEIRASIEPQRDLASRFGVSQSTIWAVRSLKTWTSHDAEPRNLPAFRIWRSPIHMPRWASRLTLTVTEVRVQRLQQISEDEAKAEGVRPAFSYPGHENVYANPRYVWGFHELWHEIHGASSWSANPWVAAITFDVAKTGKTR
jgi:hypothetical protein